ncbi:hypothetical protein NDU88_000649 [Pleurodeles waltl]|uniref:Uncharacterized protein n=1 Tax=Pleurodeles waltl TaxID=8319 RepID=A0AAV7P1I1_PLEWA|nr:hypothetical protein NDU88_000649 [Pleurodeles waltl]
MPTRSMSGYNVIKGLHPSTKSRGTAPAEVSRAGQVSTGHPGARPRQELPSSPVPKSGQRRVPQGCKAAEAARLQGPQWRGPRFDATAKPAPQKSPHPQPHQQTSSGNSSAAGPAGAQLAAKQERASGAVDQAQAQARPSATSSRRAPTSPGPGECGSAATRDDSSSWGALNQPLQQEKCRIKIQPGRALRGDGHLTGRLATPPKV